MTTHRRGIAIIIVLVLLAAIIAAFYWQPSAGWLRPPLAPEKLTIAISGAHIGSGLVQLAAAKDYFAAEGLAVTLLPHSSGRAALDAVIGNQAQIATVGDTPVMFSVIKKIPLAIAATIANATRSHGILARRDRGVAAPADLKGKTIGVTLETDGHFALNVILANHGMAPNSVTTEDTKLEDQTRWAIANHYTDATEVPNFLETLYLDGMLAVQPESVSIIR